MNNRVYGLTKGQASPTSPSDFRTKLQVEGPGARPLNPLLLALVSGATFVARAFSGNKEEQTGLIRQGIEHRGFALIDIMSPCVSFNKVHTFAWFKQRARPIGPDHDPTDFESAMKLTMHTDEAILTGLFYRAERPVFGEHMAALRGDPIVKRNLEEAPGRVREIFKKYR